MNMSCLSFTFVQSWQRIMAKAHETPSVVQCCVGDDMLKQLLPHLHDELEICQKSKSLCS